MPSDKVLLADWLIVYTWKQICSRNMHGYISRCIALVRFLTHGIFKKRRRPITLNTTINHDGDLIGEIVRLLHALRNEQDRPSWAVFHQHFPHEVLSSWV